MGILDNFSSSATKKADMVYEFNVNLNLPFEKVGDKFKDPDITITCVDYNKYQLFNLNLMAADPHAGNHRIMTISGREVKMILDGAHMPHLGLYRPKKEEIIELEELELDLERWKRSEKLKIFQKLPAHIRQDVVDEIIIRDLLNDIENVNTKPENFSDYSRVKELRSKIQSANSYITPYRVTHDSHYPYMSKYSFLINTFTASELMEAHASASLEDEIVD